jgi:tryptophanase
MMQRQPNPARRKHMTAMPAKTREMHNHHMDSTVWNDIEFRDDDIVIATYAKSGTSWMQQIVSQLIFTVKKACRSPRCRHGLIFGFRLKKSNCQNLPDKHIAGS